jgi:putative transposase
MGGHCLPKIAGEHRLWLVDRCHAHAFTVRGLVKELGERGLSVNYRSVWEFVRAEKLTYKKRRWSPASASAPTLPADAASG